MRVFKWVGYIFLGMVLLLVGGAVLAYFMNSSRVKSWLAKPQPPGKMIRISNYRLYARVAGKSAPTVVVFPAMGSASFEWWKIQKTLSKQVRVVTYDRGGYGWSEAGPAPRTSKRIVAAARTLLFRLKAKPPFLLVGHSTGAFYAQHFARLYPSLVRGIVLLDPVIDNNKWNAKLSRKLFKRFVDKTLFIKRGRSLAKFGLFRYLTVLPQTIPQQYHKHIVEVFSNPNSYKIFLDEYLSLMRISFPLLKSFPSFPTIPLTVIYHDSDVAIHRMMQFNTTRAQAELVERTWGQLTREYLAWSPKSRWVVAQKSTHQIHIDQPNIVIQEILRLAASVNPSKPTTQSVK